MGSYGQHPRAGCAKFDVGCYVKGFVCRGRKQRYLSMETRSISLDKQIVMLNQSTLTILYIINIA